MLREATSCFSGVIFNVKLERPIGLNLEGRRVTFQILMKKHTQIILLILKLFNRKRESTYVHESLQALQGSQDAPFCYDITE